MDNSQTTVLRSCLTRALGLAHIWSDHRSNHSSEDNLSQCLHTNLAARHSHSSSCLQGLHNPREMDLALELELVALVMESAALAMESAALAMESAHQILLELLGCHRTNHKVHSLQWCAQNECNQPLPNCFPNCF